MPVYSPRRLLLHPLEGLTKIFLLFMRNVISGKQHRVQVQKHRSFSGLFYYSKVTHSVQKRRILPVTSQCYSLRTSKLISVPDSMWYVGGQPEYTAATRHGFPVLVVCAWQRTLMKERKLSPLNHCLLVH